MKLRAPAPLFGALIVVLIVASAWAISAPHLIDGLKASAEREARQLTAGLRSDLGVSLSWASMSPRLWGAFTISGVILEGPGGLGAKADSLTLSYDIAKLARGSLAFTKLTLRGVSVQGSVEGALRLADALSKRFPPSGRRGEGFKVDIRDARVSARIDDSLSADAELSKAIFDLGGEGDARVEAAVSIEVNDTMRRLGSERSTAEIVAEGSLASGKPGAPRLSLRASIAARAGFGTVRGLTLVLGYDGSRLTFSSEPSAGLKTLEGEWSNGKAVLKTSFSGWKPDELFEPGPSLSFLAPWLASAWSGELSIVSDVSLEGTKVTGSLSGRLPFEMPGGRPLVTIVADGGWNRLSVSKATAVTDSLAAEFSGELRPATMAASGSLRLGYLIAPGLQAEARFDISGGGRSWFAYTESLNAAESSLRDATLSVELEDGGVSFFAEAGVPESSRRLEDIEGVAIDMYKEASGSDLARISVEGQASWNTDPYLEAAVKFDPVSISDFKRLIAALAGAPLASALSPMTVSGGVSIYSDLKSVSYSSSGLLIVYDGIVDGFGVATISGAGARIALDSLDATVAGYRIAGSASAEFGAATGFSADLRVEDVPYSLKGAMIDGSFSVSGEYGLRLMAHSLNGETLATLETSDMPVPLFGAVSFASLGVNARFRSLDDWNMVIDRLALSQPPGAPRDMPSVTLSGSFNENGGRVGRLGYSDRASTLNGSMDVTWRLRDGFRVTVDGDMRGSDGEAYSVKGGIGQGGAIDAVLSLKRAALERVFLPMPWTKPGAEAGGSAALRSVLRGWLDAEAKLSGTFKAPIADFDFTMNAGQRQEGFPFMAGSGSFGDGVVSLRDSRLRLGSQRVEGVALLYSFDDGSAEARADLSLALGKNYFRGTVHASGVSLSGPGESTFDKYSVKGSIGSATWIDGGLDDIPLAISMADGATTILLGPADEAKAVFKAGGEMSLDLAQGLPLSFKAAGRVSSGTISLDVDSAKVDMPFLFSLIGLPIVKADSGTASGSLKIRGKLSDPNVEGVVDFDNFIVSVPDFVSAPIGPLEEPLYFSGRGMETIQPSVRCGDATVYASLESSLHGGIPDDINLSVRSNGETLAPLSTTLLGLDIKGLAKADLMIQANKDRTSIDGSIAMMQGEIVLTTGVVSRKSSSAQASELSGNLSLSMGKGVEVYFPTKRLPIISGQTDPSSGLNVSFDLARGDYQVKGRAVLRGGNVFYIQRNFYLKNATIEFDEDQDQFDPRISAEAETRSASTSGSAVVTLRTTDSRLSNLSFTLESVPAMTETDIVSMLGRNLIGEDSGSEIDPWRVIIENYDLIPQLDVVSIFERNLREALGLDLMVVSTKVLQRLLYDLSGSNTTLTLADYIEDTSVMAGKYLGEKLFLQGTLELVKDTLASGSALRLDSTVSLEWKAPHFTLQWSLQPENFDSLFIEDQTFSFLWRIPLK